MGVRGRLEISLPDACLERSAICSVCVSMRLAFAILSFSHPGYLARHRAFAGTGRALQGP